MSRIVAWFNGAGFAAGVYLAAYGTLPWQRMLAGATIALCGMAGIGAFAEDRRRRR